MHGEGALYADPIGDTPYRKAGASSTMSHPDYYALKYLGALFISLHNLGTDLDCVARGKSRDIRIWCGFN
jgi:hypothetical protein